MYEVIYKYTPAADDQVAINVGDVITKAKDVGNGWFIGFNQTTRQTGLFPKEYVKEQSRKTRFSNLFNRKAQEIRNAEDAVSSIPPASEANGSRDGFTTETPAVISAQLSKGKLAGVHGGNRDKKKTLSIPIKSAPESHDDTKLNKGLSKPGKFFASKGKLKMAGSKLFLSSRSEHRRAKGVLGVLVGLLAGGVLFPALCYGYGYSLLVGGAIAAVSTFLMCLAFALSVRGRCMGVLMLPNLCTGRGRGALFSIVTGLLLAGPVITITHNANEIANTLACTTELAYNQSRQLQDLLGRPLEVLARQIQGTVSEIEDIGENIMSALRPLIDGANTIVRGTQTAGRALKGVKEKCKQAFQKGNSDCRSSILKAKRQCEDAVRKADPGSAASNIGDKLKKLNPFGRKRRGLDETLDGEVERTNREKRGVDDVCKVLDVGAVCDVLKVTDGVCDTAGLADATIVGAVAGIKKAIDAAANIFAFKVVQQQKFGGRANSSKTAEEIIEAVKEEIRQKTETAEFVVTIVNRVLSSFIFLLVVQSFLYLRSYLLKDKYDNTYISRAFRKLDQDRKASGLPSVLPLRKKERGKYIDTISWKLSPVEKRSLTKGLVVCLLNLLIGAAVCFFDYVLYWILTVIRKYGAVKLEFTGESDITFKVEGSGLMAGLIRAIFEGFESQNEYNSTINTNVCLPVPHQTPYGQLIALMSIYVVIMVLVLVQAYGLRLRRKITAYYYPERELERVQYLFKFILSKRSTKSHETKENVKEKANEMKRQKQFPWVPSCCREKKRTTCLGCEEKNDGSFVVCPKTDCSGLYCPECFKDLGQVCMLCKNED